MVFYTNVLLPREHYALKELMPRLVFNEPTFTFLSPDTTEVFVHKLCEEMINIETNQQIRLNRNIENFFKDGVFGYSTYLDKPEQDYNQYIRFMETALHAKKDDGFLVRAFVKKYNERNIIDQVHIYDEWGFTPRLSEIKKEGEDDYLAKHSIRQNCFGVALGIGAYLRRYKIPVELGITPDHPYIICRLHDGVYCASNGGVFKMSGKFLKRNGYTIYRPHSRENIPNNIMLIHRFADGVTHELLENMETLRYLSYNHNATTLPETYKSGAWLANQYAPVLRLANWRTIAEKVCPTVARSFHENHIEWKNEMQYIRKIRVKTYPQQVIYSATEKGWEKTTLFGKNYRESQKILLELSIPFISEIMEYLEKGTPFHDTIPENIQKFYEPVRERFSKENQAVQLSCRNIVCKAIRHAANALKLNQFHSRSKPKQYEQIRKNAYANSNRFSLYRNRQRNRCSNREEGDRNISP